MSVGFGLIGSGFMAHTYAQCLARHVPDGHLVAVAEGTRAPGACRRVRRRPRRDRRGAAGARRRRRRPHLHAALHPPGVDRSRRRGRQARLHREADGGHAGRLRRDDRGLPRRARAARRQPRHPPSRVAGRGQGADRRRQHRRAADRADPQLGHRLSHRRPRLGAQGRRGRRVAGHGRPPVRCAALVHRLGGRGHLREDPRLRRRPEPAPERPGRGRDAQRRHRPDAHQLRGARSPASARRASGRSSGRTGSSSPIRTARSGSGRATAGRTSTRCRRSRSTPTSTARSGWPRSPSRRSSSPSASRPAYTAAPGLHGEDGRAAVEVVEAGLRSSERGEAVHLPIDPA